MEDKVFPSEIETLMFEHNKTLVVLVNLLS